MNTHTHTHPQKSIATDAGPTFTRLSLSLGSEGPEGSSTPVCVWRESCSPREVLWRIRVTWAGRRSEGHESWNENGNRVAGSECFVADGTSRETQISKPA